MRALIAPGSAHPALGDDLARELECELVSCVIQRFPDGELDVDIQTSVRGQPVFVVQPLREPVGEHLLELLLLADGCRRAGARTVSAVIPYMGFARQDRVTKEGRPLGAKVVADVVGTAGFSAVIALDLHSPVIASCIDAPVVDLTAVPALAEALRSHVKPDSVVVAPDLGAVKLADAYARLLGLPLAVVYKVRRSPREVAVRRIAGDVRGKRPIVVDDMISTGTTVEAAVRALLDEECSGEILVGASHGLFAGGALDRLSRLEVALVVTTDSLPRAPEAQERVETVRIAPLLAEAVRRITSERGLDDLLAAR